MAKNLAKGIALGKTEGIALGKLAATRDAILLLARSRGPLPDDFEARLQKIEDLDLLYEILEKTPHIEHIEDLLTAQSK